MTIRGDEFDDLFTRTREAVEQLRNRPAEADADAEPSEPVSAEAADGQVRVRLTAVGKVDTVEVEPQLLREGIGEVCAQIVVAVNAAIDEFRSRATPVGAADAIDTAALAETLREVQTDSLRRMAAFGSAVDDVVQRLIRSGGGTAQ